MRNSITHRAKMLLCIPGNLFFYRVRADGFQISSENSVHLTKTKSSEQTSVYRDLLIQA